MGTNQPVTTPLTLYCARTHTSIYSVCLKTGIAFTTMLNLEKGLIARPSFITLMKLDRIGIPITQWAGVPAIAEAIEQRMPEARLKEQRSAWNSAWAKRRRRMPNPPKYLRQLSKKRQAARAARKAAGR